MIRVIRNVRGSLLLGFALSSLPAFAKCPIPDGGTLIVRAAAGDLRSTTQDATQLKCKSTTAQFRYRKFVARTLSNSRHRR
jgi:phosphate-selective porin